MHWVAAMWFADKMIMLTSRCKEMISCHRLKLESSGDKRAIFISLPHTCSNCQSEGDTAVTVVMSSPVLWQHRTPPVSIPLRSLAFCVREEQLQQMAAGVLVLTHCPHWISMSTELLYLCLCVVIKTATLSHISFRAIHKYMNTLIFIQCPQAVSFLVGFRACL